MFKKTEILLPIILTILFCIGLIIMLCVYSQPSHYDGVSLSQLQFPENNHNTTNGKININTADADALDILPAIGPKLANRIIAYREANGPFQCPEDLLNVYGIGQTTLDKISPFITTGGVS